MGDGRWEMGDVLVLYCIAVAVCVWVSHISVRILLGLQLIW